MIAEEKAKQLFDKYFGLVEANSILQQEENAKQCALIAVDEIIKANPHSTPTIYGIPPYSTINYWEEVKQEIINL